MTVATLLAYLPFFVAEFFFDAPRAAAACAAVLFLLTTVRLWLWHTPALWRRPLLWGLYLAFVAIDAGFLLCALGPWLGIPQLLALHAFAVGGVSGKRRRHWS